MNIIHNMRRLGLACFMLLQMLLATLAMPAAPAAAASCSGTGCNGLDPAVTGCANGAYTAYSSTTTFYSSNYYWATVRVELRWSPTCKTNWAKATITSSTPASHSFQMQVALKGTDNYILWHTEYTTIGRSLYGDMHYAPYQLVKACIHINNFSGRPMFCTPLG